MPNEEKKIGSVEKTSDKSTTSQSMTTESLQMLMANIGNAQNVPITEEHVSEVLSQRRQINEFINKDKERSSYDQKYFLTVGLIFILLISGLVIWTYPEYLSQVLSLIMGGFGGFGVSKVFKTE